MLLPSSSIHSTCLQAHRRIVVGLLPIPGLVIHQSRLALQHPLAPQFPPGSGPRRQRISWLQSVGPPSGRRTPPRKPPAWGHALSNRFLGRLKANPKRCIQSGNCCGSTQCRGAPIKPPHHLPMAGPSAREAGGCCTASFNSSCCAWAGVHHRSANIRAAGPPCQADAHRPIVCGSLSRSPPWPLPSSPGPAAARRNLSRSLGVGARIIRCRSLTSIRPVPDTGLSRPTIGRDVPSRKQLRSAVLGTRSIAASAGWCLKPSNLLIVM